MSDADKPMSDGEVLREILATLKRMEANMQRLMDETAYAADQAATIRRRTAYGRQQ